MNISFLAILNQGNILDTNAMWMFCEQTISFQLTCWVVSQIAMNNLFGNQTDLILAVLE